MLKQVIEVHELLDDAHVSGKMVAEYFNMKGFCIASTETIHGEKGKTDFMKILIPGLSGRQARGSSRTLGIIGRLGGIGARPESIGLVSDADGAIAALACAAKLVDMASKGDRLPGDVLVATHICPDAPTLQHDPVPFMDSPISMQTMNEHEVDPSMDAIISIDTTKGNKVINHRGFALSPTVKEGWILKVSEDLLDIAERTSGNHPFVLPLTMQDITPYGNNVFHINSILQPCTATNSPVVGLAITTMSAVPGCATGASHEVDIEEASRFCVEVAKTFTAGKCQFYSPVEFELLRNLYGTMNRLQTMGH